MFESSPLVTDQGAPSKELLELVYVLGIKDATTLDEVFTTTQQEWFQKGKERWELSPRFTDKRKQVILIMEKLDCIKTRYASKKHYRYAVVLGALIPSVRSRIASLIKEWERGVRFEQIIFLTGQRKLHPTKEIKEHLFDTSNPELPFSKTWILKTPFPKTETEMMQVIYDQAPLPSALKRVPVVVIDAPAAHIPYRAHRPTTESTVIAWLKENPVPGSCLCFSNQPYIGYQHAILQTLLPQPFSVETVGCQARTKLPTALFVDNIARWLFWEVKRFKNYSLMREKKVMDNKNQM